MSNDSPTQQNFGTPRGTDGKAMPPPAYNDPGVRQANHKAATIGLAAGLIFLVALVLLIYLLLQNPALTANIRDIVIILTAVVLILMSLIISVLLAILLYRVQELIHFLRAELVPILTETQKAARAVYGTTMFMSDSVAKPAIKAAGFVSRMQRMAQAINAKAKGSVGRR
ncbi:MAG: hypothetical protein NZM18_08170 [Thermoflexales bacterium]|nr:hypothetical protein [Thermoflexales bacterium]MDW8351327.1 hypothetical protein [Anaerolineae bacterium]